MITIREIYTSSGPRWSDITPDKICDELRGLTKKVKQMQKPRDITIAAGEIAYSTIRKIFPEDTETVKIKPCRYLEKEQCLIIENKPFLI